MPPNRVADQSGMTLIEVMISVLILGVVLSAFTAVISTGLRSLSESRARQTASQIATEAIETLRSRQPSSIELDSGISGIAASLANCTTTAGDPGFDPDDTGPVTCEEIAEGAGGAIKDQPPFAGTQHPVTYYTVATHAEGTDVPDGTIRVTVVLDYTLPARSATIHRQALFSGVSRG